MKPNQTDGPTRTGTRTYTKLLLTSTSAMVAETATFPIDMIKTRLQLYSTRGRTGAFAVVSDIVSKRGIFGLYIGLSPAILRHAFYTPTRIVGYEYLRSIADVDGGNCGGGSLSLPVKALVGGVSGAFAQLLASPSDLVKVRMQADGRLATLGHPPTYLGPFDAFTKIVRSEGFGGLYKGVVPNVQRAFLVNMGELACYDHAKRFVIHNQLADDNIYAHTLASIMSGLCATGLSCPADVIKTRMMNQCKEVESIQVYRSSYDCFVKTVRVEGVLALWKGFFPTWARLGPWQFVFWVSYEKLRRAFGLDSF